MVRGFRKSSGSTGVKSIDEKTVQVKAERIMFSSNSASAKKIVLNFPVHLLERTDSAAELLHTDRSKLIREAVEERVRQIEREELARKLEAAYDAKGEDALALYREFENDQLEVLGRTEL